MSLQMQVNQDDHILGPIDSPVTLVEYGDYQCPACRMAYWELRRVREALGDTLRFVFRNFPLTQTHPHALDAAEAAEAGAAQGQFWEMHDMLFENQRALTDRHLRGYAADLGLDALRFDCELGAHVHAKRVRDDLKKGVRSGVNGTPTFFINGVRYDGVWDLPALMRAMQQPLVAA